ncbi:AAA family ATPase [Acidovorax sp. YS12]|nr:AAA family ATPase [Acidovorax sp. YS12]
MNEYEPSPQIWDAMGLTDEIHKITNGLLSGSTQSALISGPPGSGKTWLAKSIGAIFLKYGGYVIRGVSGPGEMGRELYAWKKAQAQESDHFPSIEAVIKAVVNISVKFMSHGVLDAQDLHKLYDVGKRRSQQGVAFLYDEEVSLLTVFNQQARGRPVLMIADDIEWWDGRSLSILAMILKKEIEGTFPFVSNFYLLAVTTDGALPRPIWEDGRFNDVLPAFHHRIRTKYLEKNKFNEIAETLGLPQAIGEDDRRIIFEMSGGNLSILGEACHFLSKNGGDLSSIEKSDKTNFFGNLLMARLKKTGGNREAIEALLQAVTIIGTIAIRDEISCLLNDRVQIGNAIKLCSELNFINCNGNLIEFRDDATRNVFHDKLGIHESTLRIAFAECLRKLTPGDYVRRSANLFRAGECRQAADLLVAAAAADFRRGNQSSSYASAESAVLIETGGCARLIDELSRAYHSLALGDNENTLRIVNSLGAVHSKIISAEILYVKSLAELNSRSEKLRKKLIRELQLSAKHIDIEFEQGLRLQSVLRSALVLERDKGPAYTLDHELREKLSNRLDYDKSAEYSIYVLERSAESLNMPDVALQRVMDAERFHRPEDGCDPLEPSEYFRCLNNLAALFISTGDYFKAINASEKAIALADRYSGVTFPRKDMVHTLNVMARYRVGVVSASEAEGLQRAVVECFGISSDPYYTKNHLGVYLCLDGRLAEGIEIFKELEKELINIVDPEPNPLYFVCSNLCSAKYLLGAPASECLAKWDNLSQLVDKNPYETKELLRTRHDVLRQVFEKDIRMSPVEWDRYPLENKPREPSAIWPEIGRGFRMPDVQFWSMY